MTTRIADAGLSLPAAPRAEARAGGPGSPTSGAGFAEILRNQLAEVSRMQNEADAGVQRILTGQSDNLTEVFIAAKRAQVAFDLLMEIRNKLVDAYVELRQLRV